MFADSYDRVTDALSTATRGMVIPREGNRLIVGDLKQMEARVLCWLAGQGWKLDLYCEGIDLYCHAATPIFGREILKSDKAERQVGKVSELALGYGGGIGAYAKMAEGYKVDLNIIYHLLWKTASPYEMEAAEVSYILYLKRCKTNKVDPVSQPIAFVSDLVKQRWRKKNPEVVSFWGELDNAAIEAVQRKKPVKVGGDGIPIVTFFMHKQFLFCRLPSGRDIAYPYPRVHEGERGGIRLEYMVNDKTRGGWTRDSTYGGKLSENITQAVQRDILSEAMVRLDQKGYDLVLHVHDEIVADTAFGSVEDFEKVMSESPIWADGLPIGVDAWFGSRYDKR
jgi:DNA polymerase